jgi:tRNA dimethylallyltransferase
MKETNSTTDPRVICIMGPTAAGKTALAIALAQQHPFDIISVDSAMVYRGMDIGSAKPTPAELAIAPHRLIDIRDPSEPYSAAGFRQDAIKEIDDILANQRTPLLVGGTMLYFRALQQGLSPLPPADPAIRQQLLQEAQEKGWQALHDELARVDPTSSKKIHPNDPQRLQRALEIYRATGKTRTQWYEEHTQKPLPYRFINVALIPNDRDLLRENIKKRVDHMLKNGLIDEVNALFQRPDLTPTLPALRALGYRQTWQHLSGEYDLATLKEKITTATRQFAKRQLTWLRHWPDIVEMPAESVDVNQVLGFLR